LRRFTIQPSAKKSRSQKYRARSKTTAILFFAEAEPPRLAHGQRIGIRGLGSLILEICRSNLTCDRPAISLHLQMPYWGCPVSQFVFRQLCPISSHRHTRDPHFVLGYGNQLHREPGRRLRGLSSGIQWATLAESRLRGALPFVILGEICSGIFTPTESAAVAVVVTFIIGFAQKTISLRSIPKMLETSAKVNGVIVPIIAMSLPLAQTLASLEVPQ